MAKILLVEDDANLADTMCDRLTAEHFAVELVSDGAAALHMLRTYEYDLVILDWGLPGRSGIEICKEYRSMGGSARILMLTGKSAIEEKEFGFNSGVDDYLTKPFHMKELVVRLRALMRRSNEVVRDELKLGNLSLSTRSRTVTRDGVALKLTGKEFALLEFLMRHPNDVFSSNALIDRVWQSDSTVGTDTIKTLVYRLRSKLGEESNTPALVSVFGQGYKIEPKE